MELPIAVQTTLHESEERFSKLLGRLDLDRSTLARVANCIRGARTRSVALPSSLPAGGRRKYHV